MKIYYNEYDKKAAAWIMELVKEGHLPEGDLDDRSILDVAPSDLLGYDSCHFFAGIGGWPYALRLAGWPDDRPVWTGSCPCQPFSTAGKQLGTADERHLWPVFAELIRGYNAGRESLGKKRIPILFGEQVASKAGREWLVGVRADLEDMDYVVGGADLCSAGVGSPNIRSRLYWVAYTDGQQADPADSSRLHTKFGGGGIDRGMAHPELSGCQGRVPERQDSEWKDFDRYVGCGGATGSGRVANADVPQLCRFWDEYELLPCLDGKTRRVESASLTMVNGIPSLMGIDREEDIGTMEKEISEYAETQKIRPGEALSTLWESLVEETIRSGFGGPISFSSPPILLSFLRELTEQGWKFSESILCTSQKTEEALLRSLWWESSAARPPHQRGLEKQQSEESSNPLRVLSSILARYVETSWGDAVFAYADVGFPLASGVRGRVGLLRGYGNAINPVLAAEFILAAEEARHAGTVR